MNKVLLDPRFWFNTSPGPLTPMIQQFFIYFIVACVFGFVLLLIYKKRVQRSMYRRVGDSVRVFFFTNAVIGILIQFFIYELTPFLSSRFWILLWGLGDLVWLYFIAKRVVVIPRQKVMIEKEKEYKKYIP